ncbi:MAG: hypothetical protein HYR76_11905 [Ignavibacteria bacterium]|nr:hypothetical protein [Ignavibacteria bacterium]
MSMKSVFFGLILGAIILFMTGSSISQELPFTHYTPESEVNPLPSADVRTLYQDRLGYIWMVVYSSGLLRYDGHHYDRYTIDDGLPGLDVREVLEDRFGRLWVASEEGLVVSEKPLDEYSVETRIRFITQIGQTSIVRAAIIENRISLDSRGVLWVGTRENGIIRYRFPSVDSVVADTIKTDIAGDGKNKDIRSICLRRDGSMWVAIGGGDLITFARDSGRYELIAADDGMPRSNSDDLYESHTGILYGGRQNGMLWRLAENAGKRRIVVVNRDLKSRITNIIEAPSGTLWVASEGSGVMKITLDTDSSSSARSETRRIIYTRHNGLLSDNISNILQDTEGNIWLAQVGGVSKLRANYAAYGSFTTTSHSGAKPNLPNASINAVIPPTRGTDSHGLCVATTGGGIAMIDEEGEVESIQADQGLRNNWANGLAVDSKGRLWIGTTSGINCFSPEMKLLPPASSQVRSVSFFKKRGIIAAYQLTTIYACKSLPMRESGQDGKTIESLWFPGYQNLYCFVDGTWFVFRNASGLPATFFDAVAFDDEGRLWVGTRDAGLYRSDTPLTLASLKTLQVRDVESQLGRGKFGREIVSSIFKPKWDQSNGAPSNQIESMIWQDSALWIGTPEGLVVIEHDPPQMTTHLTVAGGLKGNDVTSLAFSPVTGSLWTGTNGGLAEVDPKRRIVLRTLTKQDGLVDNEVWFYGSVSVGEDGAVYFGTAKGLSLYSPQHDKRNDTPPIIRLARAHLTEDNSGNNEADFEYSALSYANEKLVRYRTRLVGYDRDWSPEKSEIAIRYTNLSAFFIPKQYTFEILASNNNGVWTRVPFQYSFSIRPPWWFRWWWLLLNVLFLVLFVYVFNRHRVRQLEKRSRMLEKVVEERTHEIRIRMEENRLQAEELATKNIELEEKNKEIVKTQEQLIIQEKLASLGALTAGIAHEIKNPLNFVNNFAELSVELIQELRDDLNNHRERLDQETQEKIHELLTDLEHNTTKINEHGKRADSIVRGMLLHSRGKSGERMPTDLNVLLDEYVHLAYHGLRAQDSNFNITIKTDYDRSVGQIDVVPQDISRVFLNIVNNACYAAHEKKKSAPREFIPTLFVCTKSVNGSVEIRIRDNGTGVPQKIIDKIFDPFFTTKPTGKGTGLGLSLSYDIVVKGHNGEIRVETEEGKYTEFIIRLPKSTSAGEGARV